ncbi:MAG TPA: outer membrane protein assembly factor BamB [Usitatibacteraceae bacterium]
MNATLKDWRSCVALVAALLALSGCGSSKPKPPELPEVNNSVLSIVWSASTGKSSGFTFLPGFADKLVYAASYDDGVYAFAEDGGREVARIDPKTPLTAGVGVADNMVVVVSNKGDVLALDPAGRSLWKAQINGEVLAAPVVAGGYVLVRIADGRLFALNRIDGKRKWVYQRPPPSLSLRSSAGVLVSRGTIYAGFTGGKVVAIELESGKPIWEATISLARGATELERIADVGGVPLVDDSRVCATVYQGRTGCVETLNGNVLWSREIPSADGVAFDAKNLYVSDTGGNVYALDKISGATLWKQEKLIHREPGTPLVLNGKILIGDANGLVHLLSPENGELIGRVATDGSRVTALMQNGDRAIVQTARGRVFSIKVQ